VDLISDLERAGARAASLGAVAAVLPAEPFPQRRYYLVALEEQEAPRWLVLDDKLEPVEARETVRQVAAIVVLCELAGELAGGGHLSELRASLSQIAGEGADQDGLSAAQEAARLLEQEIGAPPVLATPEYLDGVGAAAVRLERILGERSSPLAAALSAQAHTVEAFIGDVIDRNAVPLR